MRTVYHSSSTVRSQLHRLLCSPAQARTLHQPSVTRGRRDYISGHTAGLAHQARPGQARQARPGLLKPELKLQGLARPPNEFGYLHSAGHTTKPRMQSKQAGSTSTSVYDLAVRKDVGCFTAGATSAKTSLSIAKEENEFLCFQLHCLYTGQQLQYMLI